MTEYERLANDSDDPAQALVWATLHQAERLNEITTQLKAISMQLEQLDSTAGLIAAYT